MSTLKLSGTHRRADSNGRLGTWEVLATNSCSEIFRSTNLVGLGVRLLDHVDLSIEQQASVSDVVSLVDDVGTIVRDIP